MNGRSFGCLATAPISVPSVTNARFPAPSPVSVGTEIRATRVSAHSSSRVPPLRFGGFPIRLRLVVLRPRGGHLRLAPIGGPIRQGRGDLRGRSGTFASAVQQEYRGETRDADQDRGGGRPLPVEAARRGN